MSDFLSNNKDCFTIIISVISLVLSVYNFVYALFYKRAKLKLIIHDHYFNNDKTHQFFITIQNCSQLPISISNMQINESNFCVLEPCMIKEVVRKSGSTVIDRESTKTISFPINLNSLESKAGYLEFRNIGNLDIDNVSFTLFTNRKIIKDIKPVIYDDLTK